MNTAPSILLEGLLMPEQVLQYIHLPFEVPPGTTRIDVAYRYDSPISSDPRMAGGSTVDIGIFDERGVAFLSGGFRGWSGSARSAFFISADAATPGYLPGPIQPGTWHIALGAYKIESLGCRYRVEIRLTRGDTPAARFPSLLTLSTRPGTLREGGWYRGELHCHTQHSDGDCTVQEVIQQAERLGLDFLAITDHNNISHWAELAASDTSLMLIPGYEVTTYYGHWNIWGGAGWVDFRVNMPDALQAAMQAAAAGGYLVSCNHPRPYGPPWAFPEVEAYTCVEVWNGPWELLNTHCLEFWEAQLRQGRRLVAVGGSDFHFGHQPHIAKLAHPTTFIYVEGVPHPAALLEGLRAGHAFISDHPDGPRIMLRAGRTMMGDTLRKSHPQISLGLEVLHAAGLIVQVCGTEGVLARSEIESDQASLMWDVDVRDTGYLRAQVIDPASGHVRALTNPIYLVD